MRRAPLTAVLLTAVSGAALGACSGTASPGPTSATAPTVTVTQTVTLTASPTSFAQTTATPGTSGTSAPVPGTTAAGTTTATSAVFNRTIADQNYANLVADVRVLDGQLASGASPALRLNVLATHFAALATIGTPPGMDPPSYLTRLHTLETFALAAAGEATTNPPQATARYAVIRQETATFLAQVNAALKTTYTLPPPPPPTATASRPPTGMTTPPPR